MNTIYAISNTVWKVKKTPEKKGWRFPEILLFQTVSIILQLSSRLFFIAVKIRLKLASNNRLDFLSFSLLTVSCCNSFILLCSKISELKAKKTLLFVRHGLAFDETQVEIKMNFNITDERHSGDRKLQNAGIVTLFIAESTDVSMQSKIFFLDVSLFTFSFLIKVVKL
jgi:hypothetical protein